MATKFRLAEEDRERLSVPEVIEFDIDRPKLKEVRQLRKETGLEWLQFLQKLADHDVEATGMLLWLATRRAGAQVEWDDFDVDIFAVRGEDEEESPNQLAPDGATTN